MREREERRGGRSRVKEKKWIKRKIKRKKRDKNNGKYYSYQLLLLVIKEVWYKKEVGVATYLFT